MFVQNSAPAQSFKIDVSQDRSPEPVASLMKKMRSTRCRCGVSTSIRKTKTLSLFFFLCDCGLLCCFLLVILFLQS